MNEDSKSEDLTQKLPQSDSEKISLILTKVQYLETRIDRLEKIVEERLYDTRPIWERVVADVTQLRAEVTQLQVGQRRLEETMSSEFREVKTSTREIFYQIGAMSETMVAFQGNMRYIDSRVRELEQRSQNQSKPQT